jgi:D-amino-acid oxidase
VLPVSVSVSVSRTRCSPLTALVPPPAGPPEPAYIIPRPGGTYLKDNHSVLPDLSTAQRILRDCYNLEPLLAGKDGRGWEDIEVVAHNVGLRPAREGGARIELELRELGNGVGKGVGVGAAAGAGVGAESTTKSRSKTNKQRQVAVVHAYGFGSAG